MTLPQKNNSEEAETSAMPQKSGIGKMLVNVLSFLLFGIFKLCLLVLKGLWWLLRESYIAARDSTRNSR